MQRTPCARKLDCACACRGAKPTGKVLAHSLPLPNLPRKVFLAMSAFA